MMTIYGLELNDNRHPILVEERTVGYGEDLLDSPKKVADAVNDIFRLRYRAEEHLVMIALSAKYEPIAFFEVSHGNVCSTAASPREIYIRALLSGAVHIACVHAHPSGDCTPSAEDKDAATKIAEVGKIVGISLCDFIIIGDDEYCSFQEQGLL